MPGLGCLLGAAVIVLFYFMNEMLHPNSTESFIIGLVAGVVACIAVMLVVFTQAVPG